MGAHYHASMKTFLLKTEPSTYAFEDLVRDGETVWDGVTAPAALLHIRSARKGDRAWVYHSGDERRIVGLARIVSDAYEDPKKPGLDKRGQPKFAVFDLKPVKRVPRPVTLDKIKADARFTDFDLIRISRLSVMPVPEELDAILREWAGV